MHSNILLTVVKYVNYANESEKNMSKKIHAQFVGSSISLKNRPQNVIYLVSKYGKSERNFKLKHK